MQRPGRGKSSVYLLATSVYTRTKRAVGHITGILQCGQFHMESSVSAYAATVCGHQSNDQCENAAGIEPSGRGTLCAFGTAGAERHSGPSGVAGKADPDRRRGRGRIRDVLDLVE